MIKSLSRHVLFVFTCVILSNVGFAGCCDPKPSDTTEKTATEVAETSVDDLFPVCCAAAYELLRPSKKASDNHTESAKGAEVTKTDSDKSGDYTASKEVERQDTRIPQEKSDDLVISESQDS